MKVEHKTLSLHFVAPFPLLDFLFRFSIIFFFFVFVFSWLHFFLLFAFCLRGGISVVIRNFNQEERSSFASWCRLNASLNLAPSVEVNIAIMSSTREQCDPGELWLKTRAWKSRWNEWGDGLYLKFMRSAERGAVMLTNQVFAQLLNVTFWLMCGGIS